MIRSGQARMLRDFFLKKQQENPEEFRKKLSQAIEETRKEIQEFNRPKEMKKDAES